MNRFTERLANLKARSERTDREAAKALQELQQAASELLQAAEALNAC